MSRLTLNNVESLRNEDTALGAINENNEALEVAFDNTLSRDGTAPNQMEANLDMNGFKILNIPSATSDTEPLRKSDFDTFISELTGGDISLTVENGHVVFNSPVDINGDLTVDSLFIDSFEVDSLTVDSTLTLPSMSSKGIVQNSALGVLSSVPAIASRILTTDTSNAIAFDTSIPVVVQNNITHLGTISSIGSALGVAYGGTGDITLAAKGVLYGNGTSAVQATNVAANAVVATDSSSVPFITSTLPIAVQANITTLGTISTVGAAIGVPYGGTGNTSWTSGGVMYGNGVGALQATSAVANAVLKTDGSSNPSLSTTLPTAVQANITQLGTLTSSYKINLNTASPSTPPTGTYLQVHQADSVQGILCLDTYQAVPQIMGRRAGGTGASRTGTDSNAGLMSISGRGYGATGYVSAARASMDFQSSENWTDSAQGARIIFSTTPTGGTATAEAFRISQDASVSVNTNKFTVAGTTGNTVVAGTLAVTSDVAVNTNKFTVAASSGNTVVAGTLGVTGTSTIAVLSATSGTFSSTLGVTGDVAVNTNKFTVAASSGNTVIAGTLGVTGASTISTLGATSGTFSSTLGVTGDLAVNTNKFTVTASSGNTLVAGTLSVTGNAMHLGASNIAGINLPAYTDYTKGLYIGPAGATEGLDFWYDSSGNTVSYIETRYNNSSSLLKIRTKVSGTPVDAIAVYGSGGVAFGNAGADPGVGLIYTNAATFILRSKTTLNNGAAASTATLTNSPAVGNPTKWLPYDDNGTTRYIPSW